MFIRIISFNFLNLENRLLWLKTPSLIQVHIVLTSEHSCSPSELFWLSSFLAFHQFHQHASSFWLRVFVYAILTVWNVPLTHYLLPQLKTKFSSKLFLKHLLLILVSMPFFSGFPYPQIQVRSNYFMMLLTLYTFVSKIISVIHIWCLCVYLGQVISYIKDSIMAMGTMLRFPICIYLILIHYYPPSIAHYTAYSGYSTDIIVWIDFELGDISLSPFTFEFIRLQCVLSPHLCHPFLWYLKWPWASNNLWYLGFSGTITVSMLLWFQLLSASRIHSFPCY